MAMALYIQHVRAMSGQKIFEIQHDLSDDAAACQLARQIAKDRLSLSDPQRTENLLPQEEITIVDAVARLVISLSV